MRTRTVLSRATVSAYGRIFEVLERTAHPHLMRVWNYLPEINRAAGGDERYRHFNSARQEALRASGRPTKIVVPAASALGSPAGSPISIYFLATRTPPKMIENPRQTSAYHYPPKFGIAQSELLQSLRDAASRAAPICSSQALPASSATRPYIPAMWWRRRARRSPTSTHCWRKRIASSARRATRSTA